MVPQQPTYYPSPPLPAAYPHNTFPPNAGPGFASHGIRMPPDQAQCFPVQVGFPVVGHAVNPSPPLPPYPPPAHQQPQPNSSSNPTFAGNMPGTVMGQAVLPYPAPAPPNSMSSIQASGGGNFSGGHGQHVSTRHPPNPHHSNTHHHLNNSVQWQGQAGPVSAPSHPAYPPFAPYLQPSVPRQNYLAPSPALPSHHLHPPMAPTAAQSFPQQEHAGSFPHQPPFPAPNTCQPNSQFCDSNGTAIGVPVMGIPIYRDGAHNIPASTFQGHDEQPMQTWQPMHAEGPASESAPQGRHPKSSNIPFPAASGVLNGPPSNYHQGSHLQSFPMAKPEAHHLGLPPNTPRGDRQQFVSQNGHPGSATGYACSPFQRNVSSCPSKNQEPWQGLKREESHFNGSCSQQESQSSMNGTDSSSAKRGLSRSFQSNRTDAEQARNSASRSGYGRSGQGIGRRNDSSKDMERRPDPVRLRCDPCDRTFSSAAYLDAHNSSHVKCDEEGCTFEASGKMIKEHKVVEHGKTSVPTTLAGLKALALRLKESKEEIRRWREERNKNYPTTANILRKAEEMKARKARGELLDEDSQKRRQRLREILARQKELGLPVAEIPAHYLSDRHCRQQRHDKIKGNTNGGARQMDRKVNVLLDDKDSAENSQKEDLVGMKGPCSRDGHDISNELSSKQQSKMTRIEEDFSSKVAEVVEVSADLASDKNDKGNGVASDKNDNGNGVNRICHLFQKKRKRRKGSRSEGSRKRRQRNPNIDVSDTTIERRPSLLSKLLESDIQKDKSHLLQCFRFIVNNSFFDGQSDTLNFFEWVETEEPFSVNEEVADGVQEAMLVGPQESANGKLLDGRKNEVQEPAIQELPNQEETSEPSRKNLMEGEVPKINDSSMEDHYEEDILQYMNLDLGGTDPGLGT